MAATIKCDFMGDLPKVITSFLVGAGYKVPVGPPPDAFTACLYLCNVLRRRIVPRCRQVHESRELVTKLSLLPAEDRAGVQRLVEISQAGGDLNPFGSTQAPKSWKPDPILNDWNLHHLHLRPLLAGNAESEKGPNVLFVWTCEHDLYFVDVNAHDWTDPALRDVVMGNWPHLTTPSESVTDMRTSTPPPTRDEIKTARALGVTAVTQGGDGRVRFPPGGGYSTSGVGLQVVHHADSYVRLIRQREADYRQDAWWTAAKIYAVTRKQLDHFELRLASFDGMAFYVEEPTTGWREVALGGDG